MRELNNWGRVKSNRFLYAVNNSTLPLLRLLGYKLQVSTTPIERMGLQQLTIHINPAALPFEFFLELHAFAGAIAITQIVFDIFYFQPGFGARAAI